MKASTSEDSTWSVDRVMGELNKHRACAADLEGMARFGINVENRIGVSMPELRRLGKRIGRDHELALALWETGIADARIVAALVGEADKLTVRQMNSWARDFDSWDVCDQVCMNLFDRTPLAWGRIRIWSKDRREFVKRAAFATIASLARHDKTAVDADFISQLPLIERDADDERNYVRKAVSWALRGIGKRNGHLRREALRSARRLLKCDSRSARRIARETLREIGS